MAINIFGGNTREQETHILNQANLQDKGRVFGKYYSTRNSYLPQAACYEIHISKKHVQKRLATISCCQPIMDPSYI